VALSISVPVGADIRVVARYTDAQGTNEAVASNTMANIGNLNDAPTGSVTISGTPEEDQTLTAANTLADEDGLGAITYQWQRDGVDIAGATGASYTLSWVDVGANISVVASYTDGGGTFETVASAAVGPVANVNDAPTGSVTISGTPEEDQTLTAANTLADEDGLGAITYQWQRDGVDIAGATGTSYTLTQADVGTNISVIASYTDGQGTAEAVTSSSVGPVANANDAPTGSVTIDNTTPAQGDTLTASNTLADADGIPGPITYQWFRDGAVISGATSDTYVTSQADVGATLSVIASYTDGAGSAESVSSAATAAVANVDDPATGTVTIDNTSPSQGDVLTASNTLADLDGLSGAVTYQWQRDGIDIAGAAGTTYVTTQADVSAIISVVASYTDDLGGTGRVSSVATAVVANVNDSPTGTVSVAGLAEENQILSASNTLDDVDGMGAVSYQWQRGGVDIYGATGSSYTLTQADVGADISVVASYIDGGSTAEQVSSTVMGPILGVGTPRDGIIPPIDDVYDDDAGSALPPPAPTPAPSPLPGTGSGGDSGSDLGDVLAGTLPDDLDIGQRTGGADSNNTPLADTTDDNAGGNAETAGTDTESIEERDDLVEHMLQQIAQSEDDGEALGMTAGNVAAVTEDVAQLLERRELAAVDSVLNNHAMWDAIDKMNEQFTNSDRLSRDELVVQLVSASGLGLFAALTVYALRGGALLASWLSAIPFLSTLDPLLVARVRRKKKEEVAESAGKDNASSPETLFSGQEQA
jgi:hypothetical protein